jgi:hypothetical protein
MATNEEIRDAAESGRMEIIGKLVASRATFGYADKLDSYRRQIVELHKAVDYGRPLPEFVTIGDSTDPAMIRLPHPVRSMAMCSVDKQMAFVMGPQVITDVWAMAKCGFNLNDIMAMVQLAGTGVIDRALDQHKHRMGDVNYGAITASLHPMYHSFVDGKIFTLRNSAVEALHHTDIGGDVPCAYIHAPMSSVYIEFGEKPGSIPLVVRNAMTGDHELQGVYIIEREVPEIGGLAELKRGLGILDHEPARILDIMFVGRAKGTLLDDATFHMTVYLQDDNMPANEMIDRHISLYSDPELARVNMAMSDSMTRLPNEAEKVDYRELLTWLVKVLTYLNVADARKEDRFDRHDLLKKLAGLGQKKVNKLERRLSMTYDYILIGNGGDQGFGVGVSEASKRPHFRRGHIRMQRYGEKLSKSKVVFIAPTFINRTSLGEETQPKNYIVK